MSQQFIYGFHAVKAVLQTKPKIITALYVQRNREDKRLQEIMSLAKALGVSITKISRADFDKQVGAETVHQGIAAQCSELPSYQESDIETLLKNVNGPALILILDGVQDPHNLGACLRTANAMGVNFVLAPKDRAVGLTPAVRKVASGAAEVTPFIQVKNLARTLRMLQEQGVWLVGAAGDAPETISSIDLKGSIGIVMGSEGEGLRRLTREHCDYLAKVPMFGAVESMNVSVATGMFLYEVIRQRL